MPYPTAVVASAAAARLFHSVNDLITAIENYLNVNNSNPKPFVWTATAEQILAKVAVDESPSSKWKTDNETLH